MVESAASIYDRIQGYFDHLESVAARLEALARKELVGESFTEEDNLFFRSIVVRKHIGDERYGGYTEEDWDGWYNDLLPFDDETPQLVTDIYTNTNSKIGPVGVLHTGVGEPVVTALLVDAGQGSTIYVGPAFTYYEHLEHGYPPHRLTDEEWSTLRHPAEWRLQITRKSLNESGLSEGQRQDLTVELANEIAEYKQALLRCPPTPTWTLSFRVPDARPEYLDLPDAWNSLSFSAEVGLLLQQSGHLNNFNPVRGLLDLIAENPQWASEFPSLTDEMASEVLTKLRDKGYFEKK